MLIWTRRLQISEWQGLWEWTKLNPIRAGLLEPSTSRFPWFAFWMNPFCCLKNLSSLLSLFCLYCLSGYMAPEYAMQGRFSMKADVYSFGVIVLEIISGRRNSSFCQPDGNASSLVAYVSIKLTKFQNYQLTQTVTWFVSIQLFIHSLIITLGLGTVEKRVPIRNRRSSHWGELPA